MSLVPDIRIAIFGRDYVGLQLAVELGKECSVAGVDIKKGCIDKLKACHDSTCEVVSVELAEARHLYFTVDAEWLRKCNAPIFTALTWGDSAQQPDQILPIKASETVGKVMHEGAVIICDSTVYSGTTDEVCVPLRKSIPASSSIAIFSPAAALNESIQVTTSIACPSSGKPPRPSRRRLLTSLMPRAAASSPPALARLVL